MSAGILLAFAVPTVVLVAVVVWPADGQDRPLRSRGSDAQVDYPDASLP